MNPQSVKHHTCPRCGKTATILVTIENSRHFYRDEMRNIQYQCTHCLTTFSVDNKGKVILIRLGL